MPPYTNQLDDSDDDEDSMIGLLGRFVVSGDEVQYRRQQQADTPIRVPLVGVRIEAHVIDFIAEVKQSLCYHNTEAKPIEATYHFPLDPSAAVCGFQAEYEDGSIVKGIVKEKEEAHQEYKTAMQTGRQASLLETVRRDIFSLKVGNIPAGAFVKITLTYVTYLKAQDHAAAFVLPTTVAPRYSPPFQQKTPSPLEAQAMAPPSSSVKWFGLDIIINFAMHSDIQSLTCPSHAAESSLSCQYTGKTGQMCLQDIPMDREVVVLVQEQDSHQPRVVVEDDGTTKVGFVTLFPQLIFPDLVREFIFIVDQSGSMSGSKIQQARDTLLLFLRALPPTCTFNLIGFGNHFETLFDTPVAYNDETLEYATNHVQNLQANLGGTEIKAPLEHVFHQDPPMGVERQVFVLTDGQVSNDLQVFDVIRKNCSSSNFQAAFFVKPQKSCRLFSVGVGSGVSRHLVEGMAQAGRGTSRFVEAGQSLQTKVLGQLKQALQPALDNVSIQWNFSAQLPKGWSEHVDENTGMPYYCHIDGTTTWARPAVKKFQTLKAPVVKTLLGYCSPSVDEPTLPTQPKVKIFPSVNPPVFNKERYLSFAMFPAGCELPESVRVSCQSPDGTLDVTLPVLVDEVFQGTIAHKMAARAAISEYENNQKARGGYYRSHLPTSSHSITEAEVLELALSSSLASEKTSFIAILESPVVQPGMACTKKIIPQFVSLPAPVHRESARFMTSLHCQAPMASQFRRAMAPPGAQCARASMQASAPMAVSMQDGGGGGGGSWARGLLGSARRLSPAARTADLGEQTQAYYRKEKKMWAFPGEDAAEVAKPIGPPPMAPPMRAMACGGELQGRHMDPKLRDACVEERSAGPAATDFSRRGGGGGGYPAQRHQLDGPVFKDQVVSVSPHRSSARGQDPPSTEESNQKTVLGLCLLQKADGSFEASPALAAAMNLSEDSLNNVMLRHRDLIVGSSSGLDKTMKLCATALAVAAMRVLFPKDKNVWELQEEKAIGFIQKTSGLPLSEIHVRLQKFVELLRTLVKK